MISCNIFTISSSKVGFDSVTMHLEPSTLTDALNYVSVCCLHYVTITLTYQDLQKQESMVGGYQHQMSGKMIMNGNWVRILKDLRDLFLRFSVERHENQCSLVSHFYQYKSDLWYETVFHEQLQYLCTVIYISLQLKQNDCAKRQSRVRIDRID